LTKRKKLRADLLKHFQSRKKPNAAKIEAILVTLAETYSRPASEVPRLSIWDPYLTLAMMYRAQNQQQKAIDSALKTLESLGYIIEGGTLPYTLNAPLFLKKWGLTIDLGSTTEYDTIVSHPRAARYAAAMIHQTGLVSLASSDTWKRNRRLVPPTMTRNRSALRPWGVCEDAVHSP
jgi:hypothetical protein